MLYSDIFAKIKNCDEISLEYQDLNNTLHPLLLNHPAYKQFNSERLFLRKELDRLYSRKYHGQYSLKFIYNGNVSKAELINHNQDIGLSIDDINDIFAKISAFYDKWVNLSTELETFTNGLDFVQFFITKFNLKDQFIGSKISGLTKISEATPKLRIRFAINEKSKKCFIDLLKDDNLSSKITQKMNSVEIKAMKFEDPVIYNNNNIVLSSISHEGYYFFK